MRHITLLASFALCAMTTAAFAADSPFNGTWKLNEAKSKFTGETFTITEKAGGKMHYSNGSTIEYDFACDGKTYPVLADRTVTCTGSPAAGYDYTSMASGKVLSKSHRAVSSDGKTMTVHGTSMLPDGTTPTYDDTFKRVSGTTGMAGKWMNTKSQFSGSDTMVLKFDGNSFHAEYPEQKEAITGKLDGSDSPVSGPTVPAGAIAVWKAEGANKIHYAAKFKGKVLSEGTETVSADGKTITDEGWSPGKMSEKTVAVYEKQ